MAARSSVPINRAITTLYHASSTVSLVDVPQGSIEDLSTLADAARLAQRCLDGLIVRIALAVNRSEADAVVLEDVIGSSERRERSSTLRRDAQRANALTHLRRFAAATTAGHLGADQLDSIVQATRRLPIERHASLDTTELLLAATTLPADMFDRRVRHIVDQLLGDDGLTEASQQRQASDLRYWTDRVTGMGIINGRIDRVRFEAVTAAIEERMASLAVSTGLARTTNLAASALVELTTGVVDQDPRLE